MRRLILIPLLAFACTSALTQRAPAGGHFGGHFASHHGGRYNGWGAYPLGALYWDSLFSDDSVESEYPPLAPRVIVVQPPAAAQVATPPQDAEPAQPLLIELRGGHYVRIREDESSISDKTDQSASDGSQTFPMQSSRPSAPPPSTILVFRDGSREQISDYTIADGILYAQADYYTEGSWNQPIPLFSLDLNATVNENRARGVQFQVPAAPNQVIVGP